MTKDLKLVYDYQKEITILFGIYSLLGWDQLTYMPANGVYARAEQSSLMSSSMHKKSTSDELYNTLKKLQKEKLSQKDTLLVKKLYKEVCRARKLPEKFVIELSKTTALAYQAWDKARAEKKFEIFRPHLEKIVKLKQRECKYINEKGHPYNSLLDTFEEGMTVEKLNPVFLNLKNDIVDLLHRIQESKVYRKQKKVLLSNKFPIEKQRYFCEDIIRRIGLNNEFSRLDLSTHPFTETIGLNDVRITTNFRENPLFSFESSIHEAGHALYELQLPEEDHYTILGEAPSLGIHESQSRFWENMIGKSKPFWYFYFPKFKKEFNLNGKFDQFYKEINFVEPSLVRVESDEVTYPLHIILRYEIEIGLIDGSIKVKNLPKIWNTKMRELLGVVPKNDKDGCLQDVHWSNGAIGYFPTYALGTIYAVQLYNNLKEEKPKIEDKISKGDYSEIKLWLKEKVHSIGNKMQAEEIIRKVCKEGLNEKNYINYLNKKYSEIYNL